MNKDQENEGQQGISQNATGSETRKQSSVVDLPIESRQPEDQTTPILDGEDAKVLSFFTGREISKGAESRVVSVFPETGGLHMVYRNHATDDRSIAVPILCWAQCANGSVVAMVPWVNELIDCTTLSERFDVIWEGYYDEANMELFTAPPAIVCEHLRTQGLHGFSTTKRQSTKDGTSVVQEFQDHIGTHAILIDPTQESITLTAVVSW